MTHKDFIGIVQKACQLDGQQCSMLLNALCRLMSQAAVEQVPVTLHGLGTFISHKHPEYIQDDPQTGRQTLYPPRITYRMQNEQESWEVNPLAQQLAEHTNSTLKDCQRFIAATVDAIQDGLHMGEEVEVHGLGTFRVISSHQGNLSRVAYSPDNQMREAVNAPFNCFEPYVVPVPVAASVPTSAATLPDAEPAADTDNEEPQPVPIIIPVEVVEPQQEPEKPLTDNRQEEEKTYTDEDDEFEEEDRRSAKRKLIFTVFALVLLLVGGIWWFVSNVERVKSVPIVQESTTPVEPTPIAVTADSLAMEEDISNAVDVKADKDDTADAADAYAEEEDLLAQIPVETNEPEVVQEPKPEVKDSKPEPKQEQKAEQKPAPKTEKKAESKPEQKPVQTTASDGTVWKIQFLTSSTLYESGDKHVGGLSPISYYREGSFYKYTYGSAATKEALANDMQLVRKKFKDAFYVHFDKDGKRMGVSFSKN